MSRNRFEALQEDEEIVPIMAVETQKAQAMTRTSAIEFHAADVRKPLASAVKMANAGNRIVLDKQGSYVENVDTGERMEVKVQGETFVFDVQYGNGEPGVITLDSGAGVNVWPRGDLPEVRMLPKKPGLRMCAANGTEIANLDQKIVQLRGIDVGTTKSGFSRRV